MCLAPHGTFREVLEQHHNHVEGVVWWLMKRLGLPTASIPCIPLLLIVSCLQEIRTNYAHDGSLNIKRRKTIKRSCRSLFVCIYID